MTGWYQRRIVPHIIRMGCGCALMDEYRRHILPKARGRVLEIGLGAGANLRFYDAANVTQVLGIEPSAELRAMAIRAERPATAWKTIFGGCHITRAVRGNIERYFAISEWIGGYQGTGPRIAGWMEWGEAMLADMTYDDRSVA
jgi:hypothetical protein